MTDCISIECIFNDKLHKGVCIGISNNTRSYAKDVVRLCWVTENPSANRECNAKMQTQMTPAEAVGVGVGLIRSSIVGETLLKKLEVKKTEKKEASSKA